MSEPIQSIAQNNYILATQQEVSHDNTLSGDGTVASPLGITSDYIVVTEELIGTYSVAGSDTLVTNTFTKAGYRPIAWTVKFAFAGVINFNQENTEITNNSLTIHGYAHTISGSVNSVQFKAIITWIKI